MAGNGRELVGAGRVALVTGGGSGIGAAVARRLAAEGCRVVVADVVAQAAEAVAAEVGGRALVIDVGDPGAWEPAVAGVVEAEGALDLVHLNAGVTTQQGDLLALSDEQYRRVTRANLDGVVFGARAAARAMAAGAGGAIVATASLAGLIAFAPDPIYTLTKHGVVGFVRSAAPWLAVHGITLNCVCPGVVDTPLVGQARERLAEAGIALIPPAAIADAVVTVVRGGGTGEAWTCLAGRQPEPFAFAMPEPRAGAPPASPGWLSTPEAAGGG